MKLKEIQNSRILLSPLNWGMGHVSRCIGLINELQHSQNKVIIACDDEQKEVFNSYFNDLEFISHKGYPFKFKGKGNFSWDLMKCGRNLLKRHQLERKEVERMVEEYQIDLVVSDHRYGFRSKKVKSILVTHQLCLPVLWFEFPIQFVHTKLLRKFDRIWVMDFPDSRLAGRLSRNEDLHIVDYVGPFSRFQLYEIPNDKTIEEVLIASGPKIYAQQFIDKTIEEIRPNQLRVIGNSDLSIPWKIEHISGNWKERDEVILKAKKIISRSGYTTLMDLHYLGISAELIATPGQREQVYLKGRQVDRIEIQNL